MTKLFHRLSTRIVLEILLAVAVSAAIYAGVNAALTRFFQQYATEPAVFRRLSDRHFQDLQRFADENHLVSTDGKPFTQWNDRYHYVSLMIIRQNEALCYNSFVSYNMTYTEEDQEHFYWGSKVLPTYEYRLRLADETCKVYFSGYFDQAYTSLRKGICAGLFLISFVAGFYLLFQKHIRYIEEMEQNVSSLCSKNFSRQIPIRGSTELSTLAANINHLGDTIQLLLLTEDAKLKQKEQFVKSIAHDIRTPLTVVIGYLELLSKGYAGSPESAALFIDRALEKTNHIRRLTDDLFAFEENCRTLPLDTYNGQELLAQVSSSINNFLTSNRFRLDYADQTTITVLLAEPEPPVEGLAVSVTDKNANYCGGKTDKAGQLTVPGSSGTTNEDGNATVGYEDADGSRWTLTVQVERTETGRPIADAAVSVGRTGNITASLPKGQDMDSRHRVTVTVTDQETTPQKNVTVIVKSDLGGTAQGQTNKDGELTVPAADSAYTDDTGTAVVGQYTVIVTDTAEKPVKDALVTLLAGEDGEKDAFTVLLPDGRLLDGNDQTVVTVLLPTAKPATGLNVEVSDEQRNHAARDTDKKGQITVPDASGSAGEIIGTDTGDEDKSNTVNVDVTDQDGKPVDGAEIGVDKDGAVSVTLPDDFTFDEDGPVTVTITDNQGEAKPGVSVTVEDGDGTTAAGETGKEGKVTLPAAYHFAYLVGYRDGTIGPNRNMTRGEAAAVFARVLSEARGDELEGLRRSRFPDVRRDAWYADYVAYLEKLGVVVGYPDGLFHAEATITREQFVAMSVRLDEWMELETYDSRRGSFPDMPVSHWAADYIQEATRNGWIVGYTDGLFHGGDCITRAEVATIVNRMLGRTADERFIRHHEDELTTFRDLQNPHYWAYYDLMEAANGHTIVTGAEDETWHEVR